MPYYKIEIEVHTEEHSEVKMREKVQQLLDTWNTLDYNVIAAGPIISVSEKYISLDEFNKSKTK